MTPRHALVGAAFVALLLVMTLARFVPAVAVAQQQSASEARFTQEWQVSYRMGFNWDPPQRTRDRISLEHLDWWSHGDNYVFVGVTDVVTWLTSRPPTGNPSVYVEWQPRLSLLALQGRPRLGGALRDVMLAHEFDYSPAGVFVQHHGVSLDWTLPAGFLRTNGYVRDDVHQPGVTFKAFVYGAHALPLAMRLSGWVSFAGREGHAGPRLAGNPHLSVRLASLTPRLARWHVGLSVPFEVTRSEDRVIRRAVPNVNLKWEL